MTSLSTRTPRVTLDLDRREQRPGLGVRALLGYARRSYGRDLDNALVLSHHPGIFMAWGRFEMRNQKLDSVLPARLPELVVFVTAVRLGCSWCVDFGASLWEKRGLDRGELTEAVRWRDSDRFDACQRAAFAFAEALSGDPADVGEETLDRLADELRGHVGDAGLVEVAYLAALENMRSRFNLCLGLSSQGFSSGEACELAVAGRESRAGG